MTKEEQTDLIVLLATFKSFNEQLYNLKGSHKGQVKQWFNRLLNTANSYEKQINKRVDVIDDKNLEIVYDAITDIIYTLKESVLTKTKDD